MTDRLTGLTWTRDATRRDTRHGGGARLHQDLNLRNHLGHDDWRCPASGRWEPGEHTVRPRFVAGRAGLIMSGRTSTGRPLLLATRDAHGASACIAGSKRPGKENGATLARTGRETWITNLPKSVKPPATTIPARPSTVRTGQTGNCRPARLPSPRFTENADRTVTDRLTGCVDQGREASGPSVCIRGTRKNGLDALHHVNASMPTDTWQERLACRIVTKWQAW